MLDYKLKIGILPIRRYIKEPPKRIGIFQSDYAVENKKKCVPYIKSRFSDAQTEFLDIDFLNEEGLLYLESDCDKVAEYFRAQQIDALFIVNCNFGQERNCKIILLYNYGLGGDCHERKFGRAARSD